MTHAGKAGTATRDGRPEETSHVVTGQRLTVDRFTPVINLLWANSVRDMVRTGLVNGQPLTAQGRAGISYGGKNLEMT